MPGYYLDTSALAKRYQVEVGTDIVNSLFNSPSSSIVISRLTLVEVNSAFAMRVRMHEMTVGDFDAARKRFLGDVGKKSMQVVRILVRDYLLAEQLVVRHAPIRRLRTLDALQLALALHYHRSQPLDAFVCADSALCEIAELEGLNILNPVQPAP